MAWGDFYQTAEYKMKMSEACRRRYNNFTGNNKKSPSNYIPKRKIITSANYKIKENNLQSINASDLEIGKAGEFRVISELILRGFSPALICCDSGIDIILENGKRIQVKTATKTSGSYKKQLCETYNFSLYHGKKGNILNYNFDFLICWIIPKNAFYIIPIRNIVDRKTICINIKDEVFYSRICGKIVLSKWSIYKNNWDLLMEVKNA